MNEESTQRQTALDAAARMGLYRRAHEHGSCGVALVADTHGNASHEIVARGLGALARMAHRGAVGADPLDGDGAGVMLQIPDALLRESLVRGALYSQFGGPRGAPVADVLPAVGQYAVAMCMLSPDRRRRDTQRAALALAAQDEGLTIVAWRDVPVRSRHLGSVATQSQPHHAQAFLTWPDAAASLTEPALRLRLLRVRRAAVGIAAADIAAADIAAADIAAGADRTESDERAGVDPMYIASLCHRTIVYKGLVVPGRLPLYFVDLGDRRCESVFIVVHQRFSTNTAPAWRRAHPFRGIAHNGEINTRRGNQAWMRAREPLLPAAFPTPVLEPDGSDSSDLDNAFELLLASGREPVHAMRMLMPPAWQEDSTKAPALRAFFDWHGGLMEPWDGPALVIFGDGRRIGAALDRNGLRPARWVLTHDGLLVLASEAGVIDLPAVSVARSERLEPGGILELNLATGKLSETTAIDQRLAGMADWAVALQGARRHIPDTTLQLHPSRPNADLERLQRGFGYTEEDLALLLTPMARTGKEPVGAMGDDTPLAVLSERPQVLPHYFKQHFAQVTNPPIDPLRERMVMSLRTTLGPETALWPNDETVQRRQIVLEGPLLDHEAFAQVQATGGLVARHISLQMPVNPGVEGDRAAGDTLVAALCRLCDEAVQAVRGGVDLLVLSDLDALDQAHALVPPLLATSAVHQHLITCGLRQACGIVVASGEIREVMHVTVLLGFGASAVYPWLALETVAHLAVETNVEIGSARQASRNYLAALTVGVRKVLSKMGIATLQGYRGAQIYEAIGLDQAFTTRWFPGTASQIGGVDAGGVAREALARHAAAWTPPRLGAVPGGLDRGGRYQWRRDGETHAYGPSIIGLLQHAVRSGERSDFKRYETHANRSRSATLSLRGLLEPRPLGPAVPLDEVESVASIVRRFRTGAMSFGSLSKEAHELLAVAMNRIGARSNSGEGGEDPARYTLLPDGGDRRSAIKQIASGRFGVTPQYLLHADELQIKMAQGAKPGEGGQLPGDKVDAMIARTRHSTPGVTLISPPPHHDIYSIEDLAQLIVDLRAANDEAVISVKLVSRAGVGTIAAGVVKAGADRVLISGASGGTGASPLSSIRHAGLPWELGLAETQQVLMANGLRDRVELEVDGQIKTGRDVLLAALMGAELFGFGTSALVASGCVLMRVCHKNTCPVGVATQDPALRARFGGLPEHVTRFMLWVAESVREQLAILGARSLDEIIGRTELLAAHTADASHEKARTLDLDRLLWRPATGERRCAVSRLGPPVRASVVTSALLGSAAFSPVSTSAVSTSAVSTSAVSTSAVSTSAVSASAVSAASLRAAQFDRSLLAELTPALQHDRSLVLRREVRNTDRCIGTLLSSRVVRHHGPAGLPPGRIRLLLRGTAGQSLGAWLAPGLELRLEGAANDGVAKGMAGGRVVIRPSSYATFVRVPVIIGNAALYGATGGHLYVAGRAGERFAVRNSGAIAVVEGLGDHGCEYMTGGEVLVLGRTGRNLAAGMSGGMLWVVDEDGDLEDRVNSDMVSLTDPDEAGWRRVVTLLQRHHGETHSPLAWRLLCDLSRVRKHIVQVTPHAFRPRWLARSDDASRRFAVSGGRKPSK